MRDDDLWRDLSLIRHVVDIAESDGAQCQLHTCQGGSKTVRRARDAACAGDDRNPSVVVDPGAARNQREVQGAVFARAQRRESADVDVHPSVESETRAMYWVSLGVVVALILLFALDQWHTRQLQKKMMATQVWRIVVRATRMRSWTSRTATRPRGKAMIMTELSQNMVKRTSELHATCRPRSVPHVQLISDVVLSSATACR